MGEIAPPSRPPEESERAPTPNPLAALDRTFADVERHIPLVLLTTRERDYNTNRIGLVREGLRKTENDWRDMVEKVLAGTGIQARTGYDVERAINEVWATTATPENPQTRELTWLQSLTPDNVELMGMILQALEMPTLEEIGQIPGWIPQDDQTIQGNRQYQSIIHPHIETSLPSISLAMSFGTSVPKEPFPKIILDKLRSRRNTATNITAGNTLPMPTNKSIRITFTIDKTGFEQTMLTRPLIPYERYQTN